MEILVEQHMITPVRVLLKGWLVAEDRTPPIGINLYVGLWEGPTAQQLQELQSIV